MNMPDTFPLARYRLECRVDRPIRLPEYAGSTLRGVFGAALRRLSCLTGMAFCEGCALRATCPYGVIFDSPQPAGRQGMEGVAPNPYLIEPPAWGMRHHDAGACLSFHMVLAGHALMQLPLLILAWQRALQRGLGPGDGTATLERVVLELPDGEEEIFELAAKVVREHQPRVTIPPWPGGEVALTLITPTRIQRHGSPLGPERLTPRDLLVALLRRVSRLMERHAPLADDWPALAQQAAGVGAHGRLHWRDWTRWSGRQQQEMTLGGVVGHWTLTGSNLEAFWPFLYLGQWLHVGKNATFGLGHFRIDQEDQP